MAAPHPTTRTPQPPPALPSMPGVNSTLVNYLNTFALWCRHGFANKLDVSTAQPGLKLLAYDATPGTAPAVYMLEVNTAGQAMLAPMTLGSESVTPNARW